MNRSSLLTVVCLFVVAGCQSLPEKSTAQSPASVVSDRGGCSSCGYEVTIDTPPQSAGQQALPAPPASRPFLASQQPAGEASQAIAENESWSASENMTQAEWIEPIPEPSIPATVDEQTAKRVAGLLKRLVSPTEERQAWLGHSPYVDDLNETLASAATPSAANVAARTESTPVVTQVQHVEPQAAEPAQTAETASAPISRAEYVRLMQTLSALQSRLQQQQSGANAAMPAQATEIR